MFFQIHKIPKDFFFISQINFTEIEDDDPGLLNGLSRDLFYLINRYIILMHFKVKKNPTICRYEKRIKVTTFVKIINIL